MSAGASAPSWWAEMRSTSSPLRRFEAPEMPSEAASSWSSATLRPFRRVRFATLTSAWSVPLVTGYVPFPWSQELPTQES